MTISEAIDEFRSAANAKGDCARSASQDHVLHARMSHAFHSLMSHGEDGVSAFRALLHDDSHDVRAWVAAQLLSTGELAAVPVMEELAAEPGMEGFAAQMTLDEFRAGRLGSPFASEDD